MASFQEMILGSAVVVLMLQCDVSSAESIASQPPSSQAVAISISAQPLGKALNDWANQTGYQVLLSSKEEAGSRISPALSGSFTPEAALQQLLANSGLKYQFVAVRTVTVSSVALTTGLQTEPSQLANGTLKLAQEEADANSRLAGDNGRFRADEKNAAHSTSKVEEIIVTARKREERLQDVPVSITVLNSRSLAQNEQTRLQDYFSKVPGLNIRPLGVGAAQVLSIRGVTTGAGNPTVGVTIDDVPYGGSTSNGGGQLVPDFDPGELQRIEVLRGPQGTLYGASSMGGLIKFVTVDPSTEGVSGRLQVSAIQPDRTGDLGYSLRGSVNLPLSAALAVRASAFSRVDAGYIDNVRTGERDVNSQEVTGARLSALWRPRDTFSLALSAFVQDSNGDAVPLAFSNLSDLQQNFIPGTGASDRTAQAYRATATADVGPFVVTSLTGYSVNSNFDVTDSTPIYGGLSNAFFPGTTGAAFANDIETQKVSQEFRFAGENSNFDWLLGAFYTDEHTDWLQTILAINPTSGAVAGELIDFEFPTTYEEVALFGNLTVHVTERFDLQVGARQSQNRQTYSQADSGLLDGSYPTIVNNRSKADSFTYLVSPQFNFSPNLMVYARFASGYRAGGPNTATAGVPLEYRPDTTESYELGARGAAFDGRLSFDASIYQIDWDDIQYNAFTSGIGFQANGGAARVRGVELSATARPTESLTIAAWVARSEAELTESFPAAGPGTAFGAPGNQLPLSSPWSGSLSVDQEFAVSDNFTADLGARVSYVDERLGSFRSAPGGVPLPRQPYPSYTTVDLHGGVGYGDDWYLNLFVNNATDKRGVLHGGLGTNYPTAFILIQPRTLGMSLSRVF